MADEKRRFRLKKLKRDKEPKLYTYTFSLQGLISLAGGAVLALTLFFILGILIGRGYRPEQDVPKLAEIMPKKAHGNATATKVENGTKPAVLKATDLQYHDALKKEPGTAVAPAPKPVTKPKATPKPKPKPAANATVAMKAPKPKPGEPIYDYTYQAAAFRELKVAQNMVKKFKSAGLNAKVEAAKTSSGTWNRVLVLHRGTPDSTDTMKGVLKKFGIVRPLMKGKVKVK